MQQIRKADPKTTSGQTKKPQQDHAIKSPAKQPTGSERVKHNVLIVFAHWERNSFNGALLDTAVAALKDQGHEVTVSDLYRQKFNPLPSRDDIVDGPRNPDHFNYSLEAGLAYTRGSQAPDVAAEQAKLARADTVIFQFPLNWATVPAILKGYFDRVVTLKFAYDGGEMFDQGKFKGKTAILSMTTGAGETKYQPDGCFGDINVILWPLQNCVLRFCGWDVLSPNICFAPANATDAERVGMLSNWKSRLSRDLWKEAPLHFIPFSQFHPATGRLDDEALSNLSISSSSSKSATPPPPSKRLPIGQHSGRQVTPNSMYIPEVSTKKT